MRIYFYTGNHNNHHGIADTVLFVKHALNDCGYDARVSHAIPPGQVSILMENFDPEQIKLVQAAHLLGTRYILIGTEPIINGTFNGGIEDAHWHYSNKEYWQGRFDTFMQAAHLSNAIWVLAESMVPAYQALFPHLPVRFLPHGYVNNFASVVQRKEEERDIDFHFSGSLTDHRKAVLRKLLKTHTLVYHDANTPEYLRQDHLSRTKVCLSLRLSPNNQIPSVSRMHYHLQNSNFLLQETYALPCPLDPFVMHVPNDDVAGWAVEALALPNRREIAEAAHAGFKARFPMTQILPPLLDEALVRSPSQPHTPSVPRFAVNV